MIRYLKKEEFDRCIPLWREAFPEDSQAFIDYYFGSKVSRSRILVKEHEDDGGSGRVLCMAHLNPYEVMVREKTYTLPYIVGVATAADSRHQGHMRDVLMKMFQDLHESGTPFCYLMPASPKIYEPFGFVYVFDQPVLKLAGHGGSGDEERVRDRFWKIELRLDGKPVAPVDVEKPGSAAETGNTGNNGFIQSQEQLAAWINRWLKERYQVYVVRDKAYLDMLQEELDSEDGHVHGWFDGQGNLTVLQAFWGLHKKEQRFLYCDRDEWTCPADPDMPAHPAIMARVTDVRTFADVISVNDECPCASMDVMVRIRDSQIRGNDGLWRWRIGKNGSVLTRRILCGTEPQAADITELQAADITEPQAADITAQRQKDMAEMECGDCLVSTEVLDITIDRLASWLFGYCPLEQLLEEDGVEPPFWCRYVRPLEGIFLDEIV